MPAGEYDRRGFESSDSGLSTGTGSPLRVEAIAAFTGSSAFGRGATERGVWELQLRASGLPRLPLKQEAPNSWFRSLWAGSRRGMVRSVKSRFWSGSVPLRRRCQISRPASSGGAKSRRFWWPARQSGVQNRSRGWVRPSRGLLVLWGWVPDGYKEKAGFPRLFWWMVGSAALQLSSGSGCGLGFLAGAWSARTFSVSRSIA